MNRKIQLSGIAIFIYVLAADSGIVFAKQSIGAGIFAHPAAGQSTKQVSRDTFQCHNWAVNETNFDPTRDYSPEPIPYAPPPTKSGGSADRSSGQNATRGAARGAAMGAITGNPVSGVIIGSATSVLFGKKKRKSKEKEEEIWQQQYEEQQQQQRRETEQYVQAGTNHYQRAYSVCMTARNYKVQ